MNATLINIIKILEMQVSVEYVEAAYLV